MAPKLTLLGLPIGVFRLILDLLDKSDIDAFRLTSRACSYLSEPIIFQKITLHDQTRLAYIINEDICDRLCDSRDRLSHYVRHLQIGPLEQEGRCPSEKVLVKMLHSLDYLRDFSWNVRFAIPKRVLATLHTKWPSTRLHVTTLSRKQSGVYIPLDTDLLSSPQLHSLTYTVYGADVVTGYGVREFHSEFEALRECLLQAKSLKCLRLSVDGRTSKQDSWSASPRNLNFQDGHVFPALEELTLPYYEYSLTALHCKQWIHAMDWSHLQRLDLDRGSPPHLFVALTGQVPQLKALKFGMWDFPPSIGSAIWDCYDLTIAARFFDSIDGLEEVVAKNFSGEEFNQIRSALLEKHGRTLRKLHVNYRYALAKGWGWTDVRTFVEQCPRVRDLSLDIAMVKETTEGQLHSLWPEAAMTEFQKLPFLRNLDLVVRLGGNDEEFIVDSDMNYFIIEEAAQNRATTLFTQLQKSSSASFLESVRVKYKVILPSKSWRFIVTPGSRKGKGFVVEKEFKNMDAKLTKTPAGTYFDPFG